jgi:cell fate regulator YaaT (PSP1 superfamily)
MDQQHIDLQLRGCCKLESSGGDFQRCSKGNCTKLSTYNWLNDIPSHALAQDVVEVRFKNTRKGYYLNVNKLHLQQGDIVAVEASPGHDIGIIALTGELVSKQLRKYKVNAGPEELKKVYRKAKPADIDKWKESIGLEFETMLKARTISERLKLDMKIGDVEYQGDRTKAIFYYIADERVDFRELIKILAEEFKVRVEMRQIGARQEAGRIGGIGPCGRELCCATWLTNFNSVTTSAARYQEVSLNPQKLAGQCSKLKCCLNYELDVYMDARRGFPDTSIVLETETGVARHQKTDVFKRTMWYSLSGEDIMNLIPLPVERVQEIIQLNRKGIKVNKLSEQGVEDNPKAAGIAYKDILDNDSLTRFDERKKSSKKKKKRHKNHGRDGQNPQNPQSPQANQA